MPLIQLAIKIRGPNINSLLIRPLCKEAGTVTLCTMETFIGRGHVPITFVHIDCVYRDCSVFFDLREIGLDFSPKRWIVCMMCDPFSSFIGPISFYVRQGQIGRLINADFR